MAIKLAFSNVACPDWTIEELAAKAEQMGYAGVELRTLGADGGPSLACDPALVDAGKISSVFKAHGIEAVCLSTSLAFHHVNESRGRAAMIDGKRYIQQAAAIGCHAVRFFGHEMPPGHNRQSTLQRVAARIGPLLDEAGELGVQVLFENGGGFNRAKEWWWLFNLVEHPMLGLAWNVANAAAAGEPPSVSVPMLNSRIRLAKVKDAKLGEGSGFFQLGDGNVPVREFVKRLCGIGFDGYISVEWDRLWLPSLEEADTFLPEAHARLTEWLGEIAEKSEVSKGKHKGAEAGERPPIAGAV